MHLPDEGNSIQRKKIQIKEEASRFSEKYYWEKLALNASRVFFVFLDQKT